ncbi:MAG: hypothetical protein U0T74_02445 [Chitinophagales bacterium]
MEQKGKEQWYNKLFRIINSAVCFSLAYIILTLADWLAMGLVGKLFFKFDVFVHYYGLRFILAGQYWTKLRVTLVYGTGPFFFLVAGLFCLYIYDKLKQYPSQLNLFLYWGFVIGSSLFAAQGAVAALGAGEYNSPYYQGFSVVLAWWKVPIFVSYILLVPFAALMVYFAVNYGRPFLVFSFSYTKVNKLSRRRQYFLETAIMPFVIGALITTLVTFPLNIFVHAVYLFCIGLALLISWLALFYIEIPKDDVLKYKSLQQLNFTFLFFLSILIGFVMLTWKGIYLSFS